MADNTRNVAQIAEIAAINVEVQGMIAENQKCIQDKTSIVYDERSFIEKAFYLHYIYQCCMRAR